jgi:hypothetical protein
MDRISNLFDLGGGRRDRGRGAKRLQPCQHRASNTTTRTATTGMMTTLGWRDHIRICQLNSSAQLGDSTSTRKLLPPGDGGCRVCAKNGGLNVHNDSIAARAMGDAARVTRLGDATSTTKLLPPGNGGCRVCTKNGGLNVHNESIAARARGDTAGCSRYLRTYGSNRL